MTKYILAAIAVLALLAGIGAYLLTRPGTATPSTGAVSTDHDHTAAPSGTPRGEVQLDSRRQQLIGVRTVPVRRAMLMSEVRAAGSVTYDETRQAEISTRVDGWIRDLYVDFTGRVVRRGEPLFTLYSPELVATQQEYLLALRGRDIPSSDSRMREYGERLVTAARERLLRLEMSPAEIEALEKSGKATEVTAFRSPVAGTVVEKVAVRGMRVMAGQMLYRLADLSTVWVEAELYENDLASARAGARARVTFDAYPGRTFAGRVAFVSPVLSPETRTARVRVSLPNPGGLLKPNMLAAVVLEPSGREVLTVPPDAIVHTGTDTLAFVAEGEGRFTPRTVRIGRRTAEGVEIASGLKEGDVVAASATFFLDSESQLRGALQNYEAVPDGAASPSTVPAAAGVTIDFRSEPENPRPGDVTLFVTAKDPTGMPVSDAEVSVVLSMPAMPTMNMPAMRAEARLAAVGNGVYRGTGQVMTTGRWDVAVTLRRGGQALATRQFTLLVR